MRLKRLRDTTGWMVLASSIGLFFFDWNCRGAIRESTQYGRGETTAPLAGASKALFWD